MRPERFRTRCGFATLGTSVVALLSAMPAHATAISAATLTETAPVALILGTLTFGALSALLVRRMRRKDAADHQRALSMLSAMRASLDEYETLLAGLPELTIIWPQGAGQAKVHGQGTNILPPGCRPADTLEFHRWLGASEAEMLGAQTSALRHEGRLFNQLLTTRDGRQIRAVGSVLGGTPVLRLRPASTPTTGSAPATATNTDEALQAFFETLKAPAFIRNGQGDLLFVNHAWWTLSEELKLKATAGMLPELFDRSEQMRQLRDKKGVVRADGAFTFGDRSYNLTVTPIADGGVAGYFTEPAILEKVPPAPPLNATMGDIINSLDSPIALFDAQRQLRFFNKAYLDFWGFDPAWLQSGLDERVILDRLHALDRLPSEVDYKAWRAEHLSAYRLTEPRTDQWYLPEGRVVDVRAMPISGGQGVAYLFEDISSRLALESQFRGLGQVQTETLNALSEAVAVFGRNGKLTLHNPRLSSLWKLPMNELGSGPHIDEIAKSIAASMPEDGAVIWDRLKQSIVNLDPRRADTRHRIKRADGLVIDYSVVGLPDGQTMITFMDVTDSSNIQRLLKERNDALEEADRLKDAFVQNVSYELRSPLTNIIGFSDLLASGDVGELNDKQREYTDYIRTSSATLGTLIDNILDLATVDAGIAQVHFEPVNIKDLVKKARAGLAATLSSGGKKSPLNLKVNIAGKLPPLEADGTRIIQVLYNLLSNAVRFSEPGSPVTLDISGRGDRILITVDDEGEGVPEEMKAAMFQRFEGKPVRGRQNGAGLGLAIVETFVNLHNGTVSIEKRQPVGTRVTINLPARQHAEANNPA